MIAFLALGVLFGHFLTGAEKAARQGVIFFHTDHDFLYLLDRGSVVLPDEVSISMTVRGLPDDAHIQLWRTPKCETNWVMHVDETLADWKQYYYNPDLHLYSRSFDYYEASSNLWCCATILIFVNALLTIQYLCWHTAELPGKSRVECMRDCLIICDKVLFIIFFC